MLRLKARQEKHLGTGLAFCEGCGDIDDIWALFTLRPSEEAAIPVAQR